MTLTSPTLGVPSFATSLVLSDIFLLVEDIDRSVKFYTEKLGFVLREKQPHFADFHSRGITLALWRRDHFEDLVGLESARLQAARGAGIAILLASVEEVDHWYDVLKAGGIDFLGAPIDLPWNARGAYFADPDGVFWELYAYRSSARSG